MKISVTLKQHCVLFLLQDNHGATPLIVACGENRLEVVTFLIKNGADINLQTKVIFTLFTFPQSIDYAKTFLYFSTIFLLCQNFSL